MRQPGTAGRPIDDGPAVAIQKDTKDMPRKKLPPDPEGMNAKRSDFAHSAVLDFQATTGTATGDAIADLVCDLGHLCDRMPGHGDYRSQIMRGVRMYLDETDAHTESRLDAFDFLQGVKP